MPKLLAAFLALSLLSTPIEASSRRRAVAFPRAIDNTWLDAAVRAGKWLESVEQAGANNTHVPSGAPRIRGRQNAARRFFTREPLTIR